MILNSSEFGCNESIINPALRTLTNITYSSDDHTQMILNAGALKPILCYLSHNSRIVRYETLMVVSNILAGTSEQVEMCIQTGVLQKVIEIMQNAKQDRDGKLEREACWAISNAASKKEPHQA